MKNLIISFVLLASIITYAQEIDKVEVKIIDDETVSYLSDIDVYANSDIVSFRGELSENFGATDDEMDRYLITQEVLPSDVYYGYVLSSTTNQPISSVMNMYTEKKGWGSIAQELGIKPGSDEFHALKKNTFRIDKEKLSKAKKEKQVNEREKDIKKNEDANINLRDDVKNPKEDLRKEESKSNQKPAEKGVKEKRK